MRLVCVRVRVFVRARAFSGDRLDDHESWATMCVMCMGRPGNRISRCHFRWRNIVHDHTHTYTKVCYVNAPQCRRHGHLNCGAGLYDCTLTLTRWPAAVGLTAIKRSHLSACAHVLQPVRQSRQTPPSFSQHLHTHTDNKKQHL